MNWYTAALPAPGHEGQAKGDGTFTLAVTGIDDDQATALAIGFFIGFVVGGDVICIMININKLKKPYGIYLQNSKQ